MTVPEKAAAPEWLKVGSSIVHSTFGTGQVIEVGAQRGVPTVWIEFDRGMWKAISIESGSAHVRGRRRIDRTTKRDRAEVCNICGAHPVVMSVTGPAGTERYCICPWP